MPWGRVKWFDAKNVWPRFLGQCHSFKDRTKIYLALAVPHPENISLEHICPWMTIDFTRMNFNLGTFCNELNELLA